MYGTTFLFGIFRTCYLDLKKDEWNMAKKTMLLQQNAILLLGNKQSNAFYNLVQLASLKLKTLEEEC